MFKNIGLVSLLISLSASAAIAEEHTASNEFYVVAKGLYTIGDTIEEESVTLDGKTGGGFGLDLGYTLGHHFALEIDNSYSKNDIAEGENSFSATYWTSALDVVYGYPVTEEFTVFGKLGYEFERETANGETLNENGVAYGAGVEYEIASHYEAVAEYEGSTIDSVRGDSIYAGIKYIF